MVGPRQPAAEPLGPVGLVGRGHRLEALPLTERAPEIARLREEQRQRYREAMRLPGSALPRKEKPTKLSEFPPDVQQFVQDSLRPLLTAAERSWPSAFARTLS